MTCLSAIIACRPFSPTCQPDPATIAAALAGHDLSEFYEGGLEKGGSSKLNLRKVRRRPGEGGGGRTLKA